ncbi:uncharacterized protein KFase isoform X2 [Cherax quadricarinatus]
MNDRGEATQLTDGAKNDRGEATQLTDGAMNDRGEATQLTDGAKNDRGEATQLTDGAKNDRGEATQLTDGAMNDRGEATQLTDGAKNDRGEATQLTDGAKNDRREATQLTDGAKNDRGEATQLTDGAMNDRGEATQLTDGAKNDRGEATQLTDGAKNDRGEATQLTDGAMNDRGEATQLTDGAKNDRGEATQLTDGAKNDRGEATQLTDGAKNDRGEATQLTDGAKNDRGEATQLTDGAKNDRGEATQLTDGAKNDRGEATQLTDGAKNDRGEATQLTDGAKNDRGEATQSWRWMNHQELEEQYSPSRWSKRYSAQEIINVHVRVVKDLSQAARETVSHRIDVPYGPGPRAKLDVYGEDLPPESAIVVWVHGGYWQEIEKDISAYLVQPLYHHGILTLVVDYDLAPQVSMECIVEEIRAAVVWSCQLARQRGSHCVVLAGWSAGGHLVTQALMPGSGQELPDNTDTSLYKDIIRGVVTVSGVFDLRPLVNTYVNAPLHLTERSAWKLSPLASVKELGRAWSPLSILVTVGQHDSPEFKRQSEEFCQECVKAGLKAEYLEVELADHFSITEDLSKEDFSLTQRLISFLKTCDHMHKTKLPTKA